MTRAVPSWQAQLTNFALRSVVKRRFARAGFSQGSVGWAVSALEWALGGFRDEVASRAELAGIPCDVLRPSPLHIVVGSTEVLLDSALGSGDAARKAGVAVELRVWDSMPHAFPLLPFLPEARRALADAVRFIVERTGPRCDSSPPRPSP